MTNNYLASHIYGLVRTMDKGIRGERHGCLQMIDAPIHPRGMVAEELKLSEDLLRELADAIQKRREEVSEKEQEPLRLVRSA